MDATLPNEINTPRELVATLRGALDTAKSLTESLQAENKLLRQKLDLFLARYFGGTKNESLEPKQLELLLAGIAALSAPAPAVEIPVTPRASVTARPVRQPLPAFWKPSASCWNRWKCSNRLQAERDATVDRVVDLGNLITRQEKDLNEASARVLLSAQGKFGRDGSEVEQLGGTRISERARRSTQKTAAPVK